MRVKCGSDFHLELCESGHGVPNLGSGDVLILGGDILCARHFKTDGKLHQIYKDFLQKCADNFQWVLYLKGNHEPYSFHWESTDKIIKENLPEGIHFMDDSVVKIQDWNFLGTTLWADFRKENPLEMMEASRYLNDYRAIRIGSNYRKLRPEDTLEFHKKSKQFLLDTLPMLENQKVWICTHHAPSYQSIHPKYRMETINGSYASDLDELILSHPQIKYFSHGHTHHSFDYMIGGCRVICNPRGYYNSYNSSGLNPDFDPNFEIEVDD
jgi:hypothetical protein